MADGLQLADVKTAQSAPGFNLASAAQAATQPASSTQPNFNSISSTNLTPATPVALPPPPPPSNLPNATAEAANSTTKSLQDYITSLTPAPTAADQTNQSILDSIAQLTGQDTGKQSFELQQEQTNGVPDLTKQLTDLNGQITTGNAEYQKMQADQAVQQANVGSGPGGLQASAAYDAQTAGLTRAASAQNAAKAADLALLAARAQAVSGNINTALSLAQKATDAKYQPIEDDIKVKQAQLAALAPILSTEQKTQALAQQQFLSQQAQAVADQKDKETQINSIALNAAQAGASSDVITAIQKSPDVLSAINAAAPALGAKVASDLKQQAFDNAIKLRTAANDAARVGIEQENANIALAKLQQDNNNAAKSASNAVVTTPSGKKYVDGTNLDAAGKAAALNAGQIVLSGDTSKAMTAITNVQGQVGALLSSLQQAGVNLNTSIASSAGGTSSNTGATTGFGGKVWAAGSATPAVETFGTNLKAMIDSMKSLPGTGALVATLQSNVLTGKEDAATMQSKITNIVTALEDSENSLLVDNSKPAQILLNGKTLTLQADGTYQ